MSERSEMIGLAEKIGQHEMDELIAEQLQLRAADVNNKGFGGQVEYLIDHGWTSDELLEKLNEVEDNRHRGGDPVCDPSA